MRKRYAITSFLLLLILLKFQSGFAQDFPIYSTLFNNLYSINPSLAGSNGYGTLYLTYHKQIIGNANDAPYCGIINFHTPIGKTRTSVGFNAQTFKRSLLNTTNFSLTFAHRVDFGIDHNLRIGLSGGILNYGIDTDKLSSEELSDPALIYKLNNKVVADGQFGLNYQLKHLQIGAALPKLFSFYYIDQDKNTSGKELYPLRNYLFTASYNIKISPDLDLKPLINYRKLEYEYANSNLEFNATITYQKIGWAGASYRQKYGTAFLVGLNVKNYLSFGYTYKIVNSQVSNYNNAAHEIQLGIFFGRRPKTLAVENPEKIEPVKTISKETESSIAKKEEPPIEKKLPDKVVVVPKPEIRRETITEKLSSNPLELKQGNYVVVGAFKIKKNAQNYTEQLKEMGYESKMGFNTSTQVFYVFIYKSLQIDEATKEMESTKSKAGFENSWILTVVK